MSGKSVLCVTVGRFMETLHASFQSIRSAERDFSLPSCTLIQLEGSISTSASIQRVFRVRRFLRLTVGLKRGYDALMDKLFLIDHSLKDTGGHHFDYVRSVAESARKSGRSVSIGCHRKLLQNRKKSTVELKRSLEQLGDVRAVFRETVYQGDSWLAGLRNSKRARPLGQIDAGPTGFRNAQWLEPIRDLLDQRRRKRISRWFAAGCREFFHSLDPEQGDQVLVAASSELEVAGAADFLATRPAAMRANWHFLFHFNLFDGWTPEYESQRVAMVRTRRAMLMAMRKFPLDSMKLYATTETLADQLNCLGVARFDALPYPISSDFLPDNRSIQGPSATSFAIKERPVTLVCAGATRREKGQASRLQDLVNQIDEPLLQTGKANLLVQRPKQKRFGKRRLELSYGARSDIKDKSATNESFCDADTAAKNPINYVTHPLPRDEYRQLLQAADVGLFCYDARSYFSRCAGILVEMLACGKPVVVPAGTWLADQIQQPIQQHVAEFQRLNSLRRRSEHSDFQFDRANVPGPSGVWSFDERSYPFGATIDCDDGDRAAVVRFDWHWPRQHGQYVRVECKQFDSNENVLSMTAQAIGVPREKSSPRLLFPLRPECRRMTFSLTNAFGTGTMTIRNFSMELYSSESVEKELPIGAVGVIAASPFELPQCVTEMVTHIDHYRKTAGYFSYEWINRHHPQRTVDRICTRQTLSARVA